MIIGKTDKNADLKLDLNRLIETRCLVQANSGGGKSWALRRILEQTHGKIQQIVIDVEDEFHTLREKYDYILAGSTGGDCPADVRTAPVLARRLLELNVSAIIGIFELKAHDRIRFVRQFLDAMVNAPRELWHPVLVIVDEAHVFCPQHGEAESAGAVIDLMTRGRKRGFCGILATQRISKLHKDAAAEANNKLIGRSALDVDMKRASDELGFSSREEQMRLRTLKPGEFYAFGPALSDVVTPVRVGSIATSHPQAGHRTAAAPPPRETIKKVLAKLTDLPKQAAEEATTIQGFKVRIQELEKQLRQTSAGIDPKAMERARQEGRQATERESRSKIISLENEIQRQARILQKINTMVRAHLDYPAPKIENTRLANVPPPAAAPRIERAASVPQYTSSDASIPKAERLILTALSQYPKGRSKVQIGVLTGYAHSGGAFNNAMGALRSKGWIEGGSDLLKITAAGEAAAGPADPLPKGIDLLRQWQRDLGKAEREILDVLFEVYPNPLTKSEIADQTPSRYQANGGSFNNAIGKLRTLELIKGRRDMVLSADLVES